MFSLPYQSNRSHRHPGTCLDDCWMCSLSRPCLMMRSRTHMAQSSPMIAWKAREVDVERAKQAARTMETSPAEESVLASGTLLDVAEHLYAIAPGDCHATKVEFMKQRIAGHAYTCSNPFRSSVKALQCQYAIRYRATVPEGTQDTELTALINNFLESEHTDVTDTQPSTQPSTHESLAELEQSVEGVMELASRFFLVKYIDGLSRMMRAPWHIQARSAVLVFTDRGCWDVLSPMPRGPEVAGDSEHGITELQDITVGADITHLAPQYQKVVDAINSSPHSLATTGEGISRVVASGKRDGMCFRCFVFAEGTDMHQFWTRASQHVSDPVVRRFIDASRTATPGYLVIPASNGTVFMTDRSVQSFVVSAMALAYGISPDAIIACRSDAHNPAAAVLSLTPPLHSTTESLTHAFLSDLAQTIHELPQDVQSRPQIHTFEAIGGPQRQCVLSGNLHPELATGYSLGECGLAYLGYSITTPTGGHQRWVPHFEIAHPFTEPSCWEFATMAKARMALQDLSSVLNASLTKEVFNQRYPIANSDPARVAPPDPEGFVLYASMEAFGQHQWVYCKAKTWLYYIMHNLRPANFGAILKAPELVQQYFPNSGVVRLFFRDAQRVEELLYALCSAVMGPEMRNAVAGLPPNKKGKSPLSALGHGPSKDFRILLNSAPPHVWTGIVMGELCQHFPEYDWTAFVDQAEIGTVFRKCVMALECYEGPDTWVVPFRNQFDIEATQQTGYTLPQVPRMMWDVFSGLQHV